MMSLWIAADMERSEVAGAIHQPRHGRVVRGQHRDPLAAPLALGEIGGPNSAGVHRGQRIAANVLVSQFPIAETTSVLMFRSVSVAYSATSPVVAGRSR